MSTKDKAKMYLHKTEPDLEAPIQRSYDDAFRPSVEYRESMPDVMDSAESTCSNPVPIQQVGVSNFRLPLNYARKDGSPLQLETSVAGTVSLEARLKGINMSRIMRSFYERKDELWNHDTIRLALEGFCDRVGSLDAPARLEMG